MIHTSDHLGLHSLCSLPLVWHVAGGKLQSLIFLPYRRSVFSAQMSEEFHLPLMVCILNRRGLGVKCSLSTCYKTVWPFHVYEFLPSFQGNFPLIVSVNSCPLVGFGVVGPQVSLIRHYLCLPSVSATFPLSDCISLPFSPAFIQTTPSTSPRPVIQYGNYIIVFFVVCNLFLDLGMLLFQSQVFFLTP